MGGDSGLTHAAGALGIPVIVEMDELSKSALGIAAISPELVTEIPYNCSFETHIDLLSGHPLLKKNLIC
jgi:ADP-heptose:LPS heptosyltransferase